MTIRGIENGHGVTAIQCPYCSGTIPIRESPAHSALLSIKGKVEGLKEYAEINFVTARNEHDDSWVNEEAGRRSGLRMVLSLIAAELDTL